MVLDGERLDPGVLWLTFEAALNDTHSWAEIAHRVASEGTQYMDPMNKRQFEEELKAGSFQNQQLSFWSKQIYLAITLLPSSYFPKEKGHLK